MIVHIQLSRKKNKTNYNDDKNKHKLHKSLFKLSWAQKIIRMGPKPMT
jgi:hypothetical protein